MKPITVFNRMPRIQDPLPCGEVKLPAPPSAQPSPRFNWIQILLPLAGFLLVGSIVYGALRGDWRLAIPMLAMSSVSAVTSIIGRLIQRHDHKKKIQAEATTYASVLDQKRVELEQLRQLQQQIRTQTDPELPTLLARARERDPRLWERRVQDADFLNVRLGTGDQPSSVHVSAPHPDLPDPRLMPAHALETEYARVSQVPVTTSLQTGLVGIAGPLPERTDIARALLCNLVVHHAPNEVHLIALYATARASDWQWLRWLPHTHALQGGTERHYLADDPSSADIVLRGLLEELHQRQNQRYGMQHELTSPIWPWLVVLIEDPGTNYHHPALQLLLSPQGQQLCATGVILVDRPPQVPSGCSTLVEWQTDGQLKIWNTDITQGALACWPEAASTSFCESLARSLAPIQIQTPQSETALPTQVRLLDLMNVQSMDRYDVKARWQHQSVDQSLQVVIGEQRGGRPMILNLHHTVHGPHGLIAGTTGSGKSELLQTLALSLALTHHPHDVGFILVDFKGGGAFSQLVDLPHTQGLITDLNRSSARRALTALQAELDRRKRLFNEAGVNDITPYQDLYWKNHVQDPLPRLVVIVDEFAELIHDIPDFVEGLIGIARVGRSLGIHLILATQSPAGVVNQQIWANAKFRICLRVESRQESQEMLHRPEAADLPRIPGRGFLQVGNNDVFEPFQVARVAGHYALSTTPGPKKHAPDKITITQISALGQRRVLFTSHPSAQDNEPLPSTDIEIIVRQLSKTAEQMHLAKLSSPWPDPLPDEIPLCELLRQTEFDRWNGEEWPSPSRIQTHPGAVLGLLDDPANQRQSPLYLELDQQDGHLIVVGAPGSGKSLWTRTMIMSLAHTYPPSELWFYLLQFGAQPLQIFQDLPHVGAVITPLDNERVQQVLFQLLQALDERKILCGEAGVDGVTRLRETTGQAPPTIVTIITNLGQFRTLFQEEMLQLIRLIREGGPYGLHIILLGDRAGDIPTTISSVIARRIAFRLAEADEYSLLLGTRIRIDPEQNIPPGRGWIGQSPLEFQTASPVQAQTKVAQMAELKAVIHRMDQAWSGPRPNPIKILPAQIPLHAVFSQVPPAVTPSPAPQLTVPVGLDRIRLQPASIHLVDDGPDFIIAGTPQGGKTTLLLTWAFALAEFNSPQQVQFVVVSGRRNSLHALKNLAHLLDHCPTPDEFWQSGALARLLTEIDRRETLLNHDPVSAHTLPHIVVMLDDYDQFASAAEGQPVVQEGLTTLAKQGRNTNVHTIVAGPLPDMGGLAYREPLKSLRIGRSGFILRVLDAVETNPLGVRVKGSEVKQMVAGRGYMVRHGVEEMVQIATVEAIADQAIRLQQHWQRAGIPPARWPAGD